MVPYFLIKILNPMGKSKFEVFKSDKNNEFYFRLKAGNGEIILRSEGYTAKQNCLNGIASVKSNVTDDSNCDRKDGEDKYSFNIQAKNNQVIGSSQSYTTRQARENGIKSVVAEAPNAPIEDLTD